MPSSVPLEDLQGDLDTYMRAYSRPYDTRDVTEGAQIDDALDRGYTPFAPPRE